MSNPAISTPTATDLELGMEAIETRGDSKVRPSSRQRLGTIAW